MRKIWLVGLLFISCEKPISTEYTAWSLPQTVKRGCTTPGICGHIEYADGKVNYTLGFYMLCDGTEIVTVQTRMVTDYYSKKNYSHIEELEHIEESCKQ